MSACFAVISRESPRRAAWLLVFGADAVEILEPEPHLGRAPDGRLGFFYRARVPALSTAQLGRAISHSSAEFGLSRADVYDAIHGPEGLPILAGDDLTIVEVVEGPPS